MLDLDSPEWSYLEKSGGGSGWNVACGLREIRDGNTEAYPEVYHQVCHQFTAGEASYPAVPHLIQFAKAAPVKDRFWPLLTVGSVVAATAIGKTKCLRVEHESEYKAALEEALLLTTDAVTHRHWERTEAEALMGVLAALHGSYNLAMLLFLSGDKLSCPQCGEYIDFMN